MNTQIIEISGNKFLKIEVTLVCQKNKKFYLANMPARFLLDTYTVEPAEYDVSKESAIATTFPDHEEYFKYRLDVDRKRMDSKSFERREDPTRVSRIKGFLNKDEWALFPNTIIVTCDLANDLTNVSPNITIKDFENLVGDGLVSLAFLEETQEPEEKIFLYVPYKSKSILVIDGQHRLRGLYEADEKVIDDYELVVSFLIGFSRPVIAKQFYTINYTQKAVNKSLLYHLTGEFGRELDEITFMHETVRMLNEISQSPFYKRIKMLGTVDRSLPKEEKEKMTISQAFLIDSLVNTISKSARNSIYPPIFLYYYNREKLQIEIVRFLMRYFAAIRKLKTNDWDNPSESIICNTLGVGAFIRVFHFLFVKMFVTEFEKDPLRMRNIEIADWTRNLNGIESVDFSKQGEFGGIASGGSLNKLKEKIVESIHYFQKSNYGEFRVEYDSTYLKFYREWLISTK